MGKQEARFEQAASGGHISTIVSKDGSWTPRIAGSLAIIRRLSKSVQIYGIKLLERNPTIDLIHDEPGSNLGERHSSGFIKPHSGAEAIGKRDFGRLTSSIADWRLAEGIWRRALRQSVGQRLGHHDRVTTSSIIGAEHASKTKGGQKRVAIVTLAKSATLIDSIGSALGQGKATSEDEKRVRRPSLWGPIGIESYLRHTLRTDSSTIGEVKPELKAPPEPEAKSHLILEGWYKTRRASAWSSRVEERRSRSTPLMARLGGRLVTPNLKAAPVIAQRPTILDDLEESTRLQGIKSGATRNGVSSYRGKANWQEAMMSGRQTIEGKPEGRWKAPAVASRSQTLNYSPTVIINASLADRDIERKVLAGLLSHGRELSELMRREAAKQRRSEF